ncbi:Anoctamin-10 [Halotydeus destructor]|nr:Anoctamin-10 [Halotydeus destructor]
MLRKRRVAVAQLIAKQREKLHTATRILRFEAKEALENYDVVITITEKGKKLMEPLLKLLEDRLPQLQCQQQDIFNGQQVALYVVANRDCLIEAASILGISAVSGKLTSQQRQTIVKFYLDSIRYSKKIDLTLPSVKLVEGEAIFSRLMKCRLLDQVFPLHHAEDLAELRSTWVKAVVKRQPIEKIRMYFGPKIAMYFAFLGNYTRQLTFPALVGITATVIKLVDIEWISDLSSLVFCIINIGWASHYVSSLKTYCSQLAQKWDTELESDEGDAELNLVPRPQFRGECIVDEVTGLPKISYPVWKRQIFQYCVTLPATVISLVLVIVMNFKLLNFQAYWDSVLIGEAGYPEWTSLVPKVLFACGITLMDIAYYQIALWLNNKENYAFDCEHENHLISKLVVFQFINSFLSLFYIAFFEGHMCKLHEQLAALLITRQVIGNINEALWPLASHAFKFSPSMPTKKYANSDKVSQAEIEAALERYESTFDDHLEMFIQFGHIVMFSPVFPLASVCALLNNIVEIRSDAFKLCICLQRPFAGPKVKDIGHWHFAYDCLVYAAIAVNCGLLVKSGQLERLLPFLDPIQVLLIAVLIEHIMIAMKLVIEGKLFIPWVTTNYERMMNFADLGHKQQN